MSRRRVLLPVAVFALTGTACSTAMRMRSAAARAEAAMYNSSGAAVGTAQLWQDANGTVNLEISSLTPPAGTHGIHFHYAGESEGPGFTTGNGHYNPKA